MVRLTHFLFIFSWHSSHPLPFQFAFVYVRSSLPTNQRMDKNNASSVQSFHVHANARDAVEGAVSEAPPTRVQLDARTCSCDIREQWSFGRNIRNGSCPHTHLFVFSHSREETKTNSTVDFVCLSWEIVCYWFSRCSKHERCLRLQVYPRCIVWLLLLLLLHIPFSITVMAKFNV